MSTRDLREPRGTAQRQDLIVILHDPGQSFETHHPSVACSQDRLEVRPDLPEPCSFLYQQYMPMPALDRGLEPRLEADRAVTPLRLCLVKREIGSLIHPACCDAVADKALDPD